MKRQSTKRQSTKRKLRGVLERLEDRRLLAADLELYSKPQIDLDAPAPFFYVADGRPIGLSPVSGELLLGTRGELGFNLADLFSDYQVGLGIAESHDVPLGASSEVQLDKAWFEEVHPLSDRLVSLKVDPDVDWNAGLTQLVSSFTSENTPALEDFWTAPVLLNAESGLRQWVTDEVIVMLEPSIDPDSFFSDSMFAGYRNLLGTTDQFVATVRDASGLEALELSNNVLPNLPGVVWSTLNFVAEVERSFTPNDPLYVTQWHLNNVGQSGARVDADIDANLAWDVVRGDEGVVIAIIDDGFQTSHPDIDYWVNPYETSSPNGSDSDGNGWIDDINGLNLVDAGVSADNPNLNNINPSHSNENHGTAVAGSAATRGNNSLGVASPAFGTKIMGLKPFACTIPGGGCTSSFEAVAQTVYYAAGRTANGTGTWRGADVINISYSMSPNSVDTTAFNWASSNGRNGLGTPVFASTGNSASGAEFARVNISIPASVNPGAQLEFRYSKDGSVNSGDDRVWINWARFPNGTVERFDSSGGASGWTSSGNANWNWTGVPETSRAHGTGRFPARSGTITHNQTSSFFTPEFNSSGGFDFQYWISSEAGYDELEVFVRYRDFFGGWGSWNQTNFTTWDNNGNPVSNSSASGIASFTPNAAYPASLSSVIGVGASTDWDYKAGYSQYGTGLDFVAPSGGGNIDFWTTDRTGSAGYSNSSDYAAVSGTSFAAPLAAGVGALMLSRNPNLTASQLRSIMQNTAEQIGSASYPGGVNQFYGHGRINAHLAVLAAGVDSNDRISNAPFVPLNSTVNGRLTTTTDVNMHRISVTAGQRISIDVDHYAANVGTDTFLRLFDSAGNQIAFSDDSSGPSPEVSAIEGYIETTFTTGGNYYIGVSAFGNGSYNPVDGTGKNSVPRSRLGNYQLHVNNVSPQMLLVNTNNDSGDGKYFNGVTLRESIAFANLNPGSVIQFDTGGFFSTPRTINLSGGQGQLNVTASMTIDGANRVTVNAQNASRVFNVDDGTANLRNVLIAGMTITGGNTSLPGGGIHNRENLTITGSTIIGNTTTSDQAIGGGGIHTQGGRLDLQDSTVAQNVATASEGGGIRARQGAVLNVSNSTISGNSALGVGAGISAADLSTTVNLVNTTIADNTGRYAALFFCCSTGSFAVESSIIANNVKTSSQSTDFADFDVLFPSAAMTFDYSLVESGEPISGTGNITGVDPLLGPLANHGGPTLTHTLLPGSPAINMGDPSIPPSPTQFDQRGAPRAMGRIDIGAIEAFVVNSTSDASDGNYGPGQFGLREAIELTNGFGGADQVYFDNSMSGQTITLVNGQLDITASLSIIGPGADLLTISGNNLSRVFNVDDSSASVQTVSLSGMTIANGNTPLPGGGINNREHLTITGATILGNTTTSTSNTGGGGIYTDVGTLNLRNSLVTQNAATASEGGGIRAMQGAVLNVSNSTISGNTALTVGAGISAAGVSTSATLVNTTIANNTGSYAALFFCCSTGTFAVENSIIANNAKTSSLSADYADFDFLPSATMTFDYSLVESGEPITGTGNLAGVDPLLGPLADNGGPTLTHTLLPGSPAINMGDPSILFDPNMFDQRGAPFVRVFGNRLDIGAFEAQDITPPTVLRVIAGSSQWGASFIDVVDGAGSGGGNGLGFELANAAPPLRQDDVNRLYVQFSEDVTNLSLATLEIRDSFGVVPYSLSYDAASQLATLTLATPLPRGKYRLAVADSVLDSAGNQLDGDGVDGAGGLFNFRFDVLPADANGDGRVNTADLAVFSAAFNTQAGFANYTSNADWNGDGRVNTADLAVFAANFNSNLTGLSEPGQPFGGGGGGGGTVGARTSFSSVGNLRDSFFEMIGKEEEEEEELWLR